MALVDVVVVAVIGADVVVGEEVERKVTRNGSL